MSTAYLQGGSGSFSSWAWWTKLKAVYTSTHGTRGTAARRTSVFSTVNVRNGGTTVTSGARRMMSYPQPNANLTQNPNASIKNKDLSRGAFKVLSFFELRTFAWNTLSRLTGSSVGASDFSRSLA
jgi:hypothetical protein